MFLFLFLFSLLYYGIFINLLDALRVPFEYYSVFSFLFFVFLFLGFLFYFSLSFFVGGVAVICCERLAVRCRYVHVSIIVIFIIVVFSVFVYNNSPPFFFFQGVWTNLSAAFPLTCDLRMAANPGSTTEYATTHLPLRVAGEWGTRRHL